MLVHVVITWKSLTIKVLNVHGYAIEIEVNISQSVLTSFFEQSAQQAHKQATRDYTQRNKYADITITVLINPLIRWQKLDVCG